MAEAQPEFSTQAERIAADMGLKILTLSGLSLEQIINQALLKADDVKDSLYRLKVMRVLSPQTQVAVDAANFAIAESNYKNWREQQVQVRSHNRSLPKALKEADVAVLMPHAATLVLACREHEKQYDQPLVISSLGEPYALRTSDISRRGRHLVVARDIAGPDQHLYVSDIGDNYSEYSTRAPLIYFPVRPRR